MTDDQASGAVLYPGLCQRTKHRIDTVFSGASTARLLCADPEKVLRGTESALPDRNKVLRVSRDMLHGSRQLIHEISKSFIIMQFCAYVGKLAAGSCRETSAAAL